MIPLRLQSERNGILTPVFGRIRNCRDFAAKREEVRRVGGSNLFVEPDVKLDMWDAHGTAES